jgi:hypothetical protein
MPNGPILYPYTKFVACCDASEINFRGTISGIVSGGKYRYIGTSPFPGSGGSLSLNRCYTVTVINSQTFLSFPSPPSPPLLTIAASCDDPECIEDCNPIDCECPDGYTLIDGNCVINTTIQATYSGTLLPVIAGDKNGNYTANGVRLYTDISTAIFPVLGTGPSNAGYTVKDNNGAGTVIPQIGTNVQSNLWGSWGSCATGTTQGRLNTVGIWSTDYPDLTELCFEYCVNPTETKQYLIGMAGDNAVSFYIDNVLIVNLASPIIGGPTVPFTSWHVFPITLTAGEHTIRVCGFNNASDAAFGAEIYDIDLATFQATLLVPATSSPNCGNVPTDLDPYILFSTQNMIGSQVPDPNDPGVWSCPDGSILDECNGVPMCSITDSFPLECPCYLLAPCNGEAPNFISSTLGLAAYVNQFVNITNGEYTGCVYVIQLDPEESCEGSVDVLINSPDLTCDCQPICYYIEGAEGISYVQYIDPSDNLLQISSTASAPWVSICSKIYPIVSNTTSNYTITSLGPCIDDECAQKCYKLTDCDDPTNILYSTSFVLLPHALNADVIKIAGFTECWIVEITEEDCDCAIDVSVTFSSSSCEICREVVAYKLTSCNELYVTQYTYQDLSAYVDQVLLTDCGCFIVELINYPPPSTQVITIITSFDDCPACERPYYRLTECTTNETIDTSTDLGAYVDKIVKLANCDGCYTVALVIIPDNPSIVTVTDSYETCVECITTAPCVCSNVRNDNATDYTYDYIDCYGELQSLTVAPGATSSKVCLIKWLEPDDCNCLIVATTVGAVTTYSIIDSTGILINSRPSWEVVGVTSIYYDGTQWIKTNDLGIPDYYLPPSKATCPSGIWKPFSSIPQVTPTTITTNPCQSYYTYFGDCNNGLCPAPAYPKRGIKPGYNTPACSAEKYEEISCKSSQILYRQVLKLRYGISNCCPEEDEYWLVKKELIDLAALYNPDYLCAPTSSCGCGQLDNCGCNSCNS